MEESASEWIAMWIDSFPQVGDPPVIQYPLEATFWNSFIAMLDQKFVLENVVRQYKEDFWNYIQGTTENICNFIVHFDCLRMLNAAVGPQVVVIFEHTVQALIFQLMQLQTYSNHSLTEAFKAAEKVGHFGKRQFSFIA